MPNEQPKPAANLPDAVANVQATKPEPAPTPARLLVKSEMASPAPNPTTTAPPVVAGGCEDTFRSQDTFLDSQLHAESPRRTNETQKTPSKTNQDQKSPSKSNQNQRSPGKSNQNQKTPGKSNQDQTPSKSNQDQTPSKSNQDQKTPSKSNQDQKTPSKPGSDEPPIKRTPEATKNVTSPMCTRSSGKRRRLCNSPVTYTAEEEHNPKPSHAPFSANRIRNLTCDLLRPVHDR